MQTKENERITAITTTKTTATEGRRETKQQIEILEEPISNKPKSERHSQLHCYKEHRNEIRKYEEKRR